MKTLIPFILLICGLGLAAFVWYGDKHAARQSDEERVLEAALEQQRTGPRGAGTRGHPDVPGAPRPGQL